MKQFCKIYKKILSGLFLFILLTFGFNNHAFAAVLSFIPDASVISTGGMVDVDIVVSGLENTDIGAFDFNINYDDSVLVYNSYILGNELGVIPDDAEDWSLGDSGGAAVNIAEISYLDDLNFQLDEFILATITFTGNSIGTSVLTFSDVDLGDAWGDPVGFSQNDGSIQVVPIPATLYLFSSGILFLASRRKK